jgi:hypothetical protein
MLTYPYHLQSYEKDAATSLSYSDMAFILEGLKTLRGRLRDAHDERQLNDLIETLEDFTFRNGE